MTDVMLNETDPNAYFNDVPLDFGPVLFDVMKKMSDEVGPFEYLIGLSMRDPDAHDNVLALALEAESKLGDLLDGMLLGNVCLYSGRKPVSSPKILTPRNRSPIFMLDMKRERFMRFQIMCVLVLLRMPAVKSSSSVLDPRASVCHK